jgi:hypothetical protein
VKHLVAELGISFVVYLCVMAGALFGMWLRHVLPPEHMNDDTRQIVNVATGLIATLAALVLGLMVASAKSAFDARAEEVRDSGARLIMLDRTLRQLGAEMQATRGLIKQLVEGRIKRVWGPRDDQLAETSAGSQASEIEAVRAGLFAVTPKGEAQKWLHERALSVASDLEQARWLLIEESRSSIPKPFLIVLVFWLVVIFASLGLFAPPNATVRTVIFICAFSVATAIFLVLEMDQPYEGILQISDAPLRTALREMSR